MIYDILKNNNKSTGLEIKIARIPNAYFFVFRDIKSGLRETITLDNSTLLKHYLCKYNDYKFANVNIDNSSFNLIKECVKGGNKKIELLKKYNKSDSKKLARLYKDFESKFYNKHKELYERDFELYDQAYLKGLKAFLKNNF